MQLNKLKKPYHLENHESHAPTLISKTKHSAAKAELTNRPVAVDLVGDDGCSLKVIVTTASSLRYK